MSTTESKETKADSIDAAPAQFHHEIVPQETMRNEGVELLDAVREPYGPGGTSCLLHDVAALIPSGQ